jgi:hypothetical protein
MRLGSGIVLNRTPKHQVWRSHAENQQTSRAPFTVAEPFKHRHEPVHMSTPAPSPLSLAPMIQPEAPPPPHGWTAQTELATRFLGRQEDQQDANKPQDPNIGKAVGANTWEYFVSCAPSDALAQQFEARMPVFVALHSLGEASSKRFLVDVAQYLKAPVQRLVIRRQGFGTELAVIYFADLMATNGQLLRLYSTDIKTDDATRHLLGKLLLSRAQMVALMVGEMPRQAMESSLTALGQDVRDGRRGSCALVVLPYIASTTLEKATNRLAQQSGLQVRRSPRASRTLDAWPFLASTWNHILSETKPGTPAKELMLIPVPELPAGSAPVAPARAAALPQPAGERSTLQGQLATLAEGVATLKGVHSCCVFNARTLSLQAQAGASEPAVELMVRQGRMLIATMQASSQVLGLGKVVKEGVITFDAHQLMLRLVPGAPNMVLLVLLQLPSDADLSIFKAEVNRLQAAFKLALSGA